MSSFLDFTGLSELVTKLKSYFMKKPTTVSSSSYPLVGYDSTNNVGKYNSDITLDMANKWISALSKGVYQEYELGTTSAGDDLNDYNDPVNSSGITVLRIGSGKDKVQHKPVDSAGCCVVVSNAGGFAHQLYFATNNSNTAYMRERYSASWGNWKQIVLSDGTYPYMTVGTIRYANATFTGASNGCNILLTDFTTNNKANDHLNARFLIILTRASTGSDSCGSAILEINARNTNYSPYIAMVHAELNILKYSNIFDTFTINVTKVSDRTIKVYATCLTNSNWGGIRLIPISCGSYGDSHNFAGPLTLYNTTATAASSREGTDVTITRNTTAKIPMKTQVGSALQPVYVNSAGQVQKCFLGIYSYTISSNYYRLATVTFNNADAAYAGCQFAVSWRSTLGVSGSGILAISFSEYSSSAYGASISGSVLVTYTRSTMHTTAADKLFFYAKKVTNGQYIVGVYSNGPQLISIALMSSGDLSSIDIPSAATTDTGTGITILPYSVPTVTYVYPT